MFVVLLYKQQQLYILMEKYVLLCKQQLLYTLTEK